MLRYDYGVVSNFENGKDLKVVLLDGSLIPTYYFDVNDKNINLKLFNSIKKLASKQENVVKANQIDNLKDTLMINEPDFQRTMSALNLDNILIHKNNTYSFSPIMKENSNSDIHTEYIFGDISKLKQNSNIKWYLGFLFPYQGKLPKSLKK